MSVVQLPGFIERISGSQSGFFRKTGENSRFFVT